MAAAPSSRASRQARTALARVAVLLATVVCLLFLGSLRDTSSFSSWLPPPLPSAPKAPAGDAELEVRVVDSEGLALADTIVRVFTLGADGVVYFAGERWSRAGEPVTFQGLPRGEVWVLGYGKGRTRGAARAQLGETKRLVTLALAPAEELLVRVVDDQGAPVLGAEVMVSGDEPLPHVLLTGPDGTAKFDRLGAAPWGVSVEAEGYDDVARSGVYPDVAALEIKLERLGGFEVSVIDTAGQPASFAEVLISGPGVWPPRSALADENGQVSILGLYAGVYDLRARLGSEVSARDLNVILPRGAVVERTLTLQEGRFVLVSVTDGPMRESGLDPPPVADADVVLAEEGLTSFPVEGRTGKDGAVLLGPISPGPITVSARASGFVGRMVAVDEPDASDVTVALLKGGAIFGDVRDERGFPVEGAAIEVFGTDLDGMPTHESSSREGFRDDLFAFSLSGPLPLIPRGELGVVPGPVPPIPQGGGAFGGAPGGGDPWVTRADGTFRASPVTPGRVQVLVKHPEFTEAVTDVIAVGPGSEVEVHIVLRRGGRLEGRVLEEDRFPVVGARLELAALEGTFQQMTYAGDDGDFAAASVPEIVLVSVFRPDSMGEVAARLEVEVPAGKRTRIEIVLPKARESSTLRFEDERGYPISRVEVRVQSLDRDTVLTRTLFSNDDGEVEVPSIRGLPARIVAEGPKRAPLVEVLDAVAKEHEFQLQPGRTLRGFVTGRGGREKLEGASVTLFTLAGARHATTDEDGGFESTDLGPGRIRLVTRAEGYALDERVIDFVGDVRRATEIDKIDLLPAGSVEGTVRDENDDPVAAARVGWGAVPTYLPVGRLPSGLVQTDADGRFELPGLPEGKVVLEAYSPDLGRGRSDEIEVRRDRVTRRVVIVIPAQSYEPPKIKGAGSVAVTLAERKGSVVIVDVPEGGEAEHAGLEPEDRILSLANTPISSIAEARDFLSGPLGEDVVVELERPMPSGPPLKTKLRVRRESVRR